MNAVCHSQVHAFSPLGPLPECWQLVRLKDITTKIGSGATPKGGSAVYLPTRRTYALVRSQNVFDRRFDAQGLAYISDEHASELRGAEVQATDILLNITGDGITFGRACIAPRSITPACVNQHVTIIRVDPVRCSPGYLLSYLTHPLVKEYIESFNAGGSRRAVTKGNIESFELPLPPLAEQQAIADILGSLDDKIELNRRMSETLEGMAAGDLQKLVRGLRPGAGQGRRSPAFRYGRRDCRPLPRLLRGFTAGQNPKGLDCWLASGSRPPA